MVKKPLRVSGRNTGHLRFPSTVVRSERQEEEKSPHCQFLHPGNLYIFTKSTWRVMEDTGYPV